MYTAAILYIGERLGLALFYVMLVLRPYFKDSHSVTHLQRGPLEPPRNHEVGYLENCRILHGLHMLTRLRVLQQTLLKVVLLRYRFWTQCFQSFVVGVLETNLKPNNSPTNSKCNYAL